MSFSSTIDASTTHDADVERGHKVIAWCGRLISWGCGIAAAWGCASVFGGICMFIAVALAVAILMLCIHIFLSFKLDESTFAALGAKVGAFTGWASSFIPKAKAA